MRIAIQWTRTFELIVSVLLKCSQFVTATNQERTNPNTNYTQNKKILVKHLLYLKAKLIK